MEHPIYLPTDELMSVAFEYTLNRPINEETLETLKELSVNPKGIYTVARNDKEIRGTLEWKNINSLLCFEHYYGISTIKIAINTNDTPLEMNYSAVPYRVLKAMANLPQAKELILISSPKDKTSISRDYVYIQQWLNLFDNIEKLQLTGLTQPEVNWLPKKMTKLKKLSSAGILSLDWLNGVDAPNLEVLDVWGISGLQTISDLTDRFPHLKKIAIRNTKNIYQGTNGIRLGKVSDTLAVLDLMCSEFLDVENLPNSAIKNLRLIGCEFDPSTLPQCKSLCAIELDHVILTKEVPQLSPLTNLNYLVLVDCGLHSISFAKGLHNLQIFNVCENPLKVTSLTQPTQEYPQELACLADMPNLLELCMNQEIIANLSNYCKPIQTQFPKVYTDMLRR